MVYVVVDTDGYILQVNLPLKLKARPLIAKQATSCPADLPVPKSLSNDFENINSMADVI